MSKKSEIKKENIEHIEVIKTKRTSINYDINWKKIKKSFNINLILLKSKLNIFKIPKIKFYLPFKEIWNKYCELWNKYFNKSIEV